MQPRHLSKWPTNSSLIVAPCRPRGPASSGRSARAAMSISSPQSAYVGHVGRQKPQWTQSAISSADGGWCGSKTVSGCGTELRSLRRERPGFSVPAGSNCSFIAPHQRQGSRQAPLAFTRRFNAPGAAEDDQRPAERRETSSARFRDVVRLRADVASEQAPRALRDEGPPVAAGMRRADVGRVATGGTVSFATCRGGSHRQFALRPQGSAASVKTPSRKRPPRARGTAADASTPSREPSTRTAPSVPCPSASATTLQPVTASVDRAKVADEPRRVCGTAPRMTCVSTHARQRVEAEGRPRDRRRACRRRRPSAWAGRSRRRSSRPCRRCGPACRRAARR